VPIGARGASVITMHGVEGTVEGGTVRLAEKTEWPEGQRVLVIALPADAPLGLPAPPADLLEEDARDLAPRREVLHRLNEDELG
jgi:hypothetical protein